MSAQKAEENPFLAVGGEANSLKEGLIKIFNPPQDHNSDAPKLHLKDGCSCGAKAPQTSFRNMQYDYAIDGR